MSVTNTLPKKIPGRRWVSWLIKGAICSVILFAIALVSAPYTFGWVIGKALQSQLSTRMKAKLEFDRVRYTFPYGLRIYKAHLLMPKATTGPDSWIDIGRLELRLAKLPIGGPLVIERLEIENPTVRLASDFGSKPDEPPKPVDTSTPPQKLSDLFRLQSVSMTGGRFEYDLSTRGRPLPPVIWDHLDATINTRPTAVSNYEFALALNDKPLAAVKASGQFDIDSLMLELDHLNIAAACDSREQAAQLPPVVQDVIRRFQIGGQVALDGSAHLPLRAMDGCKFNATLSLKNGQCTPPGWIDTIKPAEGTLTCSNQGAVYNFQLSADDGTTAAMHVGGTYNTDTQQFDLPELQVHARCDSPQLPPQIVRWVRQNRAKGELTLTGNAHLPAQHPSDGDYDLKLVSQGAQLQPDNFKGPITATDFAFHGTGHAGIHHFEMQMNDGTFANLKASGTVNPSLLLDINSLKLHVVLDPNHPTDQLPVSIANAVGNYQPGAELNVKAAARVDLHRPEDVLYFSTFDLQQGHLQLPDWKGPITDGAIAFSCSNSAEAQNKRVTKISDDAMPTHLAQSHLWLDNISADAGKQNLKIESGGEMTFDPGTKHWSVRKLHGEADVGNGPGPLDGANVRLWLPFVAAGSGTLGDDASSIRIALDNGAARVLPQHILIDALNGVVIATPIGISTSKLTGTCALGTIGTTVNLGWKPNPAEPKVAVHYDGDIHVRNLDLHVLAMQYTTDPKVRQQAFGTLNFNNAFHGSILKDSPKTGADSVADRLAASGDFDINHGYFLAIPILKQVLTAMNNPGAAVAGEAAATFDIAHQVVNLNQVAVSSPAIGVQGNGTVGFDQKLNMMFVATPLSDWSKDLKGTGIGVLQGLAGIAGQAQNLVNKAQSLALYQCRVSGNFDKPVVTTVPVPILSDSMGPLFDKMSSNHAEGSMSEELKKQK